MACQRVEPTGAGGISRMAMLLGLVLVLGLLASVANAQGKSPDGEKSGPAVEGEQGEPQQAPVDSNPFGNFWVLLLMMGGLWFFVLIRPQMREKKKRQAILAAMKKNDRVVTLGGIIGTVVDAGEREVTLQVDTDTRLKVLRQSIQTVITEKPEDDNGKSN